MRLTRIRVPAAAGFTILELMIALALMGVLMVLAAPSFTTWTRNAQVRTVAETLQNGLRAAQAEATRRNRQVVFFLSANEPGLAAEGVANGNNWVLRWIPLPGDTVVSAAPANEPFVQGGALGDYAGGVTLTGPAAVCFNAIGRRIALTDTQTGVNGAVCEVDATAPLATFIVARAGADRPLRVTVALGGQIRLCDPARVLSGSNPDGCPT